MPPEDWSLLPVRSATMSLPLIRMLTSTQAFASDRPSPSRQSRARYSPSGNSAMQARVIRSERATISVIASCSVPEP